MNDPRLNPPPESTEDAAPEPTFPVPNRADARAFRRHLRAARRRRARERDQATAKASRGR